MSRRAEWKISARDRKRRQQERDHAPVPLFADDDAWVAGRCEVTSGPVDGQPTGWEYECTSATT